MAEDYEALLPPWLQGSWRGAGAKGRRILFKWEQQTEEKGQWQVTVKGEAKDTKATMKTPKWMEHYDLQGRTGVALMAEVSEDEGGTHIDATTSEAYVIPRVKEGKRWGEAFSGIGGWNVAARMLGYNVKMAVDSDPVAVQAYAKTWRVQPMTVEELWNKARSGHLPDAAVVEADILDLRIWAVAGLMEVNLWTASPPCQPWSTSGRTKGLATEDGMVLASFLGNAAISGVEQVLMENVPGLLKHPHAVLIRNFARFVGMPLITSDVYSVDAVLPLDRNRWLGIFQNAKRMPTHKSVQVAKLIQ